MFYRRRASPKHRYSIIEVDYGGGGHRTRLRDPRDQFLFCSRGVPLPSYIKEPGGGGRLARRVMTHKYRGSIIVLSISKSVEPNEEQKEMISGFQQGILCKY